MNSPFYFFTVACGGLPFMFGDVFLGQNHSAGVVRLLNN